MCFEGVHKFNNTEAGRGRNAGSTQAGLRGGLLQGRGSGALHVRCAVGLSGCQFILIPVDRRAHDAPQSKSIKKAADLEAHRPGWWV